MRTDRDLRLRAAALAILGAVALLFGACTAQSVHAAQPTAAAFLENDARFHTFAAIVERAGRMDLLRHRDLVTVFAPTDEAFAVLPEATVRTLREDPEAARAFVDLHIIDRDLIHEASGTLVSNGAVNPVANVVALPSSLHRPGGEDDGGADE